MDPKVFKNQKNPSSKKLKKKSKKKTPEKKEISV
jgi:hypothetical protein